MTENDRVSAWVAPKLAALTSGSHADGGPVTAFTESCTGNSAPSGPA